MTFVYHGSTCTKLKEINPFHSNASEGKTDGIPVVCASEYKFIATAFVHNVGRDSTCKMGFSNGKLILTEQKDGGFEEKYPEKEGAIYTLPATDFHDRNGCWHGVEVMSVKPVVPIEIMPISNIRAYMLELENNGFIEIIRYQA